MNEPAETDQFRQDFQATLERRFYAAMIDMIAVAAGCFGVVQGGSVLLPAGVRAVHGPALVMLGIMMVLEAVTGRSVGKLVMRLRVERVMEDPVRIEGHNDENRSSARATILQTIVRAGARWFAPLVSLASVLTRDLSTASILAGGSVVVVICEVPACYITLFRRGGTVFDLIAGTRVVPANSGVGQ